MKPVKPTSWGLSNSTYSLPPRAWAIGLFKVSASSISGLWLPAQPRPQKRVTRSAPLRRSASAWTHDRGRRKQADAGGDRPVRRRFERHVARDDDDGDAAESNGGSDCVVEHV